MAGPRKVLRRRRHVYVVGAGFSAGLNYPLISDLLIRLWPRLPKNERSALQKVITFHHPNFDPERATSYPNIETLLSEMLANEQLFEASRAAPGGFTLERLQDTRQALLLALAEWFHELYQPTASSPPPWLQRFAQHAVKQDAIIISFNWDLVLEQQLFGKEITSARYGLGDRMSQRAFILKPHGSLNWFGGELGKGIRSDRKQLLLKDDLHEVYRFIPYRPPSGKQTYVPLIIPPVLNKSFSEPIFTLVWRRCVSALSTARSVTFLGYSLPEADLQARFILRCGFFNQREGELSASGRRLKATGEASVAIVNPDLASARRLEAAVGPVSQCEWYPTTVERWFETNP